jgi:DNA-3-methyladenine glycosylase
LNELSSAPGHGPVGRIRRITRDELPIDTVELARYLIGRVVVHERPEGRVSGRIVETEAYPIGDPACHAFRGMTAANCSLWLDRGHAYVYFIYGSSYCLNVASETAGVGAGVLLRAIEPLDGIELMERRRRTTRRLDLARGPGRLAAALAVDRQHDGVDLVGDSSLWLGAIDVAVGDLGLSGRIGLSREAERPLRFYEAGNPYVSGPKRLRGNLQDRPAVADGSSGAGVSNPVG